MSAALDDLSVSNAADLGGMNWSRLSLLGQVLITVFLRFIHLKHE